METFIGILILIALVALGVFAVLAWVRAAQEKTTKHYVGASITTVLALIGFWFVFFSGVLS